MFLYYILKEKKLQLLNLKQAQFIKNLNQKKLDLKYVKKTKLVNLILNFFVLNLRRKTQKLSIEKKNNIHINMKPYLKNFCYTYNRYKNLYFYYLFCVTPKNRINFTIVKNILTYLKCMLKFNEHSGINLFLNKSDPIFVPKLIQKSIRYVIVIKLMKTNILININDMKGKPLFNLTSGIANLKGKQKTKQPSALINLLRILIAKNKYLKAFPVAVHFYHFKRIYLESLAVRYLKQKFFITSVKSYNLLAHNGCRQKKRKRF